MNEYDKLLQESTIGGEGISGNEYDELLRKSGSELELKLRQSMKAAQRTTPDIRAKAIRLADKYRMPVGLVERNLDRFESIDAQQTTEYDLLLQQAPHTAAWLADPDNAAISSDDIPTLARLEQQYPKVRPGLAGNLIRSVGDRSLELSANFLQFVANAADAAGGKLTDALGANPGAYWDETGIHWTMDLDAVGLPSGIDNIQRSAAALEEVETGYVPTFTWEAFKGEPTAGNLAGFILEQGVHSLPDMVAALTALPSYVASRSEEIAEQRTVADERGTGAAEDVTGKDLATSIVPAVASALLERIGAKAVFGVGREGTGTVLQQVRRAAAREGLTEFAQEQIEFAGETVGTRTGFDPLESLERGLAGAIAGGGFGGTLAGTRASTQRAIEMVRGQRRARAAQADTATMDRVAETAQQSGTAGRMPEKLEAFLSKVREDGDVDTVYVPAERWNTFFQSQGLDAAEAYAQVTGSRAGYAEATATGADLAMPAEQFIARVASRPDWYQGVREDLRLDPDAMTMREARAFEANAEEAVRQFLETSEQDLAQPADDSSEAVRQDILGQLLAAGVERSAAERQAQLTQAVFRTLGERTGQDPQALFERFNVQVGRELPEVLQPFAETDTALDPLIDRLRADDVPTQESIFGPSLTQFLRSRGGLQDDGGELSARDLDKLRGRPGERRLVSDEGLSLDAAAEAAFEAGYLTEQDPDALLAAIDREVAGEPVFAPGGDEQLDDVRQALLALDEELVRLGVDLNEVDNGTVKQLLRGQLNPADLESEAAGPVRRLFQRVFGREAPQGEVSATYLQSRGSKRGRIEFTLPGAEGRRTARITLMENADLSTFLHETGHLYLEVLGDLAQDENATEQIRTDYQTLLDWFGVAGRDSIGDEQHEQFARGFEAYLMEGKAPTVELQSVFARIRAWLIGVYRNIRNLSVELTDEVRGVFDRLVATDDEIAAAQEAQNYRPMPDEVFGNEREREAYRRATEAARQEAEDDLTRQAMSELTREQKAWWREERDKVRAEVQAEVDRQPVYGALAYLQQGTRPDGSPLPENIEPAKLSKAELVDTYGEEFLKRLPRPGNKRHPSPYLYTRDGGQPAHLVAQLFGFSSGDELVQALVNARPRRKLIEAETNARMRERFGDLLNDGTLADKAMAAVHNDKRVDVMFRELRALQSRARNRAQPTTQQVVKAAAQRIIGEKRVRDIRPDVYRTAEARAAREAFDAAARGDYDAATAAKRRQILNHELYRQARDARAEAEEIQRFARRFDKKTTRARIGKAGGEFLERIDELLGRYEFRNVSLRRLDRRQSLREWVDEQEAPLTVPEAVLDEARRVNWREVPMEELRGIRDTIAQIEHLAAVKNKLMTAKEEREREEVVSEVLESIYEHGRRERGGISDTGRLDRTKRTLRSALSLVANPDTILRELDGFENFGAAYRHIKGIIDRDTAERLIPMREQAGEDLAAIYDRHYTRLERAQFTSSRGRRFISAIGESLTREEILAFALNWGNEGNRAALLAGTKLRNGQPITEGQVQSILGTMDKRDWDFVQDVWDYLESYYPQVAEAQRRRTGIAPPQVEPSPVETPFGTYRGGYYPLKYDPNKSIIVSEEDVDDIFNSMRAGRFGRAQTKRGHTIARVGSGGRPVQLSLSVLHRHLDQVVMDLAIGDSIGYAYKVLTDKRVKEAFEATGNLAAWDALDVWLKDTAVGEMVAGDVVSRGLRWIRTGFTTSVLGWNIGTALIQPTGYLQSSVQIGPEYAVKGLTRMVRDFRHGQAQTIFGFVAEQSPFMRTRMDTFNKDIWDSARQMKGALVPEWFTKSLFYLIAKTQQIVDTATWLGAYQKAMDGQAGPNIQAGDADTARQFADRMVARSQASGIFGDRSALERGTFSRNMRQTEAVRIWTTLSSYMIAKGNVAYERTRVTNFRDPGQVLHWAMDMALLFTIEAMLIGALRGYLPDEDDDETLAGFAAKETARQVLATIPFIREFASETQGFRGAGAFGAVTESFGRAYEQINQGEADKALVKNINSLGGILLHYPSAQSNRFIDALWRDIDGEDVPWYEYLVYRKPDDE